MEIQEQTQGAITVLKPKGALTQDEAEAFGGRLAEVHRRSLGRFVLDFSAVPFIDSLGLEALLDASERLADSGQTLKLCAENETLREVLELTDLARLFEHFDEVNSAVRSFL